MCVLHHIGGIQRSRYVYIISVCVHMCIHVYMSHCVSYGPGMCRFMYACVHAMLRDETPCIDLHKIIHNTQYHIINFVVHSRSQKMACNMLLLHVEEPSMFSGVGLNKRDMNSKLFHSGTITYYA